MVVKSFFRFEGRRAMSFPRASTACLNARSRMPEIIDARLRPFAIHILGAGFSKPAGQAGCGSRKRRDPAWCAATGRGARRDQDRRGLEPAVGLCHRPAGRAGHGQTGLSCNGLWPTLLSASCCNVPSRPGSSRRASQPKPISCHPAANGYMRSSTTASASLPARMVSV